MVSILLTPFSCMVTAPKNPSIFWGPLPFHFLGQSEFALRQGFPSGETLGRACGAAASPCYSIFNSFAISFILMVSILLTPFSCMVTP